MQLEFNVTLDNTNCHIRAYKNHIVHSEMLYEHPHKHYSMEFHCIFGGEEVINLSKINRLIHLCEGDILLLPLGVYHGVYTDNTSVDRICFNFSAEPSGKKSSPIVDLFLSIKEPTVFSGDEVKLYVEQCRRLFSSPQDSLLSIKQGMQLLSLALDLMDSVAGVRIKSNNTDSLALRQRWIIEDYIAQHFTDDSGIEGLAQALFLSQRQTSTLVKKFMGEDFKSIIIRRRMELAEIYLANPKLQLDEIAYRVGYRSYSGFVLCFKRYFGVTPNEKRSAIFKKQSKREM